MKSILQTEKRSYLSGDTRWLEKHHIFGGANRKLSEKYGLWVWLTHYEHNEPPTVCITIWSCAECSKDGDRQLLRPPTRILILWPSLAGTICKEDICRGSHL